MPTTPQHTWSATRLQPHVFPEDLREIPCAMEPEAVPGATYELARGTVLGIVTATGLWNAYDDGHGDGTEVAVGILPYDISVDDAGHISLTETASQAGAEFGQAGDDVPVVVGGYFRTSELVGLDFGRLLYGDVVDGLLKLL